MCLPESSFGVQYNSGLKGKSPNQLLYSSIIEVCLHLWEKKLKKISMKRFVNGVCNLINRLRWVTGIWKAVHWYGLASHSRNTVRPIMDGFKWSYQKCIRQNKKYPPFDSMRPPIAGVCITHDATQPLKCEFRIDKMTCSPLWGHKRALYYLFHVCRSAPRDL